MSKIFEVFGKSFLLWLTGGILYFYFEIMVRGYSHISMLICGGLCFLVVGIVGNKILRLKIGLAQRIIVIMLVGSFIITLFEFIAGAYVNLYLGLQVWDYTSLKYNFLGQICLLYSMLWGVMSLPCVYFNGIINRFMFDKI